MAKKIPSRDVMSIQGSRERLAAAQKILNEDSKTVEKIESLTTLLNGLDPKVDKLLSQTSQVISTFQKLEKGEFIDLAVENLPEKTAEEKRKKRRFLAFLKFWRQLQGEVERVKSEFEKIQETEDAGEKAEVWGKIISGAKGFLGTVTFLAVIIAGVWFFLNRAPQPAPTIERQVIEQTITSEDSVLSYWVKEDQAEINPNTKQITWSVHVHKENFETRKNGQDIPAAGAMVMVELRGGQEERLSGTVGPNGWVSWTRPTPARETKMFIVEVKGELPWSSKDKEFWKNREAASYKPDL